MLDFSKNVLLNLVEENLPDRDFAHVPIDPAIAQPSDAVTPAATNESDPVGSCSTVLLLSKIPNQDGNKRLLRGAGFGITQLNSREKLSEDLKNNVDICAILADGSFLREMNADEQISFFDDLAIYSTFAWIRIDETELKIHSCPLKAVRTVRSSDRLSADPSMTGRFGFAKTRPAGQNILKWTAMAKN